jgi:hypothetical protein
MWYFNMLVPFQGHWEGTMPNGVSTLHPSESKRTPPKDGRAEWERPALRRLAASEAQHGGKNKGDGEEGHS